MKSLLIVFALLGFAAAAILPDSATQGPNPQDIATPEPEYIDIDLPEPAANQVPIPPPAQIFSPVPRFVQQQPIQRSYSAPVLPQIQNQFTQELPGHYYGPSGYQYRRPVFIRRVYRRRY